MPPVSHMVTHGVADTDMLSLMLLTEPGPNLVGFGPGGALTPPATGATPTKRKYEEDSDDDAGGDLTRGGSASVSSSRTGDASSEYEAQQRKLRLARNRESARESRKRKKERVAELEAQLEAVKRDNEVLREQVETWRKAAATATGAAAAPGSGAAAPEVDEASILKRLQTQVETGAPDAKIAESIALFRRKFVEFGAKASSDIQTHMDELERVLTPTDLSRFTVWLFSQPDSFYAIEEDDGLVKSPDDAGPASLWNLLRRDLEVTNEQVAGLLQFRGVVREVALGVQESMRLVARLRHRAHKKNQALDAAVESLQSCLAPRQQALYIMWVHNHPECMALLTRMWQGMPGALPAPSAASP